MASPPVAHRLAVRANLDLLVSLPLGRGLGPGLGRG
jgi:hypothetical protein